jgi:hypothetical protein
MVNLISFRPAGLFLIGLLTTSLTPIWGQITLRQVRPFQLDRPDTAYFYSAAPESFTPYFSGTAYVGSRYSRPIQRLSLGVRSTYSHRNQWFLFSNLEYALGISLVFLDGMAGFNGSTIWAKPYKRTLTSGQESIKISKRDDRFNYFLMYESEKQKYSTWRIGLTQETNIFGGYNVDGAQSNVLGYRYQALRVGVGTVNVKSIVYKLKRSNGKTSDVSVRSAYADVLIPFASQIRYYENPPNGQVDQINSFPGIELGILWNRSCQGFKKSHKSLDVFAGIHGVHYPKTTAFYIGLRYSIFGIARHGKNPHNFAVK